MAEEKQTQGNKKLNQIIGDLKRNAYFLRSLNSIRKELAEQKNSDIQNEDEIEGELTDRLIEITGEIESISEYYKSTRSKTGKIVDSLIDRYAIDPELITELSVSQILKRDNPNIDKYYDMCKVMDLYDQLNNADFRDPPIQLDVRLQQEFRVYPIHLQIHRLASKRDVLDFIEKRWNFVESFLDSYREKKPRIRQRKMPREITDLIWANRKLSQKNIKELLDEKFPKNTIVYNEIYKIISIERKRRQRKIIVGR